MKPIFHIMLALDPTPIQFVRIYVLMIRVYGLVGGVSGNQGIQAEYLAADAR
jgi:hypothetical protein